jgi:hypothetical protein
MIIGSFKKRGVLAPMTKDMYEPILAELKTRGVHFIEEVHRE